MIRKLASPLLANGHAALPDPKRRRFMQGTAYGAACITSAPLLASGGIVDGFGQPLGNWTDSMDSNQRSSDDTAHRFPSLLHARTEIENWRREYNEERPKRALGGLTPTAYAEQLQ
jgi:putative transposase